MARDTPHSDAAAGSEAGAKATPACSGASSQTLSQPPESASHPNQVTELLAGAAAAAAHSTCLPASFSHRVPHYRQMHTWDCGVACVLMVLRALGSSRHHWGTLLELCPTHSIWTIDLAHLLAACGARCQLATVTLGANQAYSGAGFYAEHIQQDSARVERLFGTAAAAGIGLACRSVTLDELSRLLLGGSCLIIALVDRLTLDSPSCGSTTGGGGGSTAAGGGGSTAAGGGGSPRSTHHPSGQQSVAATAPAVTATAATTEVGAASVAAANTAAAAEGTAAGSNEAAASAGGHEPEQQEGSEEEQGGEAEAAADAYVGHFIVLCGYDSGTHAFEMRDPASHRERQWVPAARLEAARKRFGTDEDLLLVEAPPVDAGTGAEAAPGAEAAAATGAAEAAAATTAATGAAAAAATGVVAAAAALQATAAAQQAGSAAACATATALR
ncbi:hypothetical protein D9Q98_004298 [Chlorella vulgaris]|uniref:Guanylyl cyclase n=1 Tax=Chlorella vulgaris TaxID=3077 RepID=A0A9D4YYI0_CHLVU|nr:hypothetical protein D9Q98_004298 [Chlorella vulgaris]